VIEDLDVILSEGESHTVEFKERADKTLPSEVCAFANASGGRVFIGVDDGRVVGTDVGNDARSRIQDTINQIEPRLNVDLEVVGSLIVVTVPEGARKPYSCAKGFYLRSGPNSQKLERDSIIGFFQSEGLVRYDEIVREDLPLKELFNEAAYDRYVDLAKISGVLGRDAVLKNLGCAGAAGEKLCFTNAGALFFRANNEDVAFRHAGVVCALYKGTDKAYILDAKELEGDLIGNIDDAMVFLKKHLRLGFRIDALRRKNVLEIPEDALREAIVNAVCHRDYFEKGARVMVEIFDDRIDIVSPGGACRGITKENFGTVSIARNPVVASMLYRIGYIEQMGTGIMRMKKAAREANALEPEFEFSGFFRVTFRRRANRPTDADETRATKKEHTVVSGGTKRHPSDTQATPNRSQSGTRSTFRRRPSDTQAAPKRHPSDKKPAVIGYMEKRGRATAPDIAKLFGVTDGWARTLLRQMAREGAIEKVGDNRYAYYVLKR
jgi:ATP-dependent DNA helicase RecG